MQTATNMFCCKCGTQRVAEANFCHNCGHSFTLSAHSAGAAENTSTECTSGTSTSGGTTHSKSSTLSFKDFMRQKEHHRQSKFQPKNKKFKPNSCKGKEKQNEVSINIGYMKLDGDGNLKRCRGKTLPIKVLPSAGRHTILEKAVKKHANHDKNILGKLEHVLLNSDGNEITTLPGTEKEFVLSEYKEDIGKNYNRITLFIALKSAHMYDVISKLKTSMESETESTDSVEDTIIPVSENTSIDSLTEPRASNPAKTEPSSSNTSRRGENSKNTGATTSRELHIECPTCFKYFSINDISEHADICCDIWVGDVSDDETPENTVEATENSSVCSSHEDFPPAECQQPVTVGDDTKDVKDIILQLKAAIISPKLVRLNVRRKFIWSDFIESRSIGKVSPTDNVKIVFIGECAIDDGGPRREFFSGITTK